MNGLVRDADGIQMATTEASSTLRPQGLDMQPFLAYSIAATLWVFALPASLVFGLVLSLHPDPPVAVTALASIILSSGASVVGAAVWARQPSSIEISFGDLMLWGWWKRRRAEEKLNSSTRLLGLDRSGQPVEGEVLTRDRQLKVLHELNTALEAKDPYTGGHSDRVERHVYRTAAAMGLSSHDLEELRMAAALHDIGKIRVPDRIIRKPGALTPDERAIIEEHSVVGAWMLSHVATADVIEAVRYHHERWDGKGYPDGLAGTDIPLYARIIAVCDTFDAITSTRPYRAKSDRERAIAVLKEERGRQFDPMAVDAFLTAVPAKLPIAAVFLMLPGLGRVLREVAVGLKRAGAVSLAGATTVASASVIMSAATIAPFVDRLPSPARATSAVSNASTGASAAATTASGESDETQTSGRSEAAGARSRTAFGMTGELARRAASLEGSGVEEEERLEEGSEGEGETGGTESTVPGPNPPAAVLETGPGSSDAALENAADLAAGKGKSQENKGRVKTGDTPASDNAKGSGNSNSNAGGKAGGNGSGKAGGNAGGKGKAGGSGGGKPAPGTPGGLPTPAPTTEPPNPGGGNPNAGGGNPNPGGGNPNAGGGNPNAGGGNPNAGGGNPNAGGPPPGAGGGSEKGSGAPEDPAP